MICVLWRFITYILGAVAGTQLCCAVGSAAPGLVPAHGVQSPLPGFPSLPYFLIISFPNILILPDNPPEWPLLTRHRGPGPAVLMDFRGPRFFQVFRRFPTSNPRQTTITPQNRHSQKIKEFSRSPKTPARGPKMPQDGPKMAPRRPQDATKTPPRYSQTPQDPPRRSQTI